MKKKKPRNAIDSRLPPVVFPNNPERILHQSVANVYCIKALHCYRQVLEQKRIWLSVASDKRRPSSFKNNMALEPMRPDDSKDRETQWYVVESSTNV